MEIDVEFTSGNHSRWTMSNHNAIDLMIAALKENLDQPWVSITITIRNTEPTARGTLSPKSTRA